MKNKKTQELIYRITSIALCLLLLIIVLVSYFRPIISTIQFSLTPYDLIKSFSIDDLDFGSYVKLRLSYYVCKYFYIVFASLAASTFFLVLYYFVTNDKNLNKYTTNIMIVIVLFMFTSMLFGLNYVNIYNTINAYSMIQAHGHIFFFIGLGILIMKFTAGILLGKSTMKDELKQSNVSITFSFALVFLTLSTLFTYLYIFPGTRYRLRGIDILFNKEDVMAFLPMSKVYRWIIIFIMITSIVSFLINVILFIFRRKIFIHYNKYNNFLGIIGIITYALMGVNYMIVYVDAGAYTTYLNTSINTYSYIPLTLFIFFWLGSSFTKIAESKVTVEYNLYPKMNERHEDNDVSKKIEEESFHDSDAIIPDPIPAFSELDKNMKRYNSEYEMRNSHIFTDITLPKLVKHIIEYAKHSKERLSYGPIEVKTFIAGLAASRLSILQGMSGTGKTSLPKIFMESIDGICDLVAIESSWRDKNELLGHYSEFNKKYTPKSFTQFLYKASLNKDVPYFIVLDEMNLSRIEYYFSDFLSLMEARENMRSIKLFDVQLYPNIDERTHYLALRNGHTIYVPTNVWFIGTANRDESTFDISDKVYDRAQTMNFDKRKPKVHVKEQIDYPQKFVPYFMLRKLFDETKTIAFDAEKCDVIKKVEELLRPYKISFGNRVLKQIEEFVNAYVACSEISTDEDREKFILEAVDCIIFSKIVRKLELKQVTDIDTLIDEFEVLNLTKCKEFLYTLVETIY